MVSELSELELVDTGTTTASSRVYSFPNYIPTGVVSGSNAETGFSGLVDPYQTNPFTVTSGDTGSVTMPNDYFIINSGGSATLGSVGNEKVPSFNVEINLEQARELEKTFLLIQQKHALKQQIIAPSPTNHRQQMARACSYSADFTKLSGPEIVALQLLKKMLPKTEWTKYLKYGFILAKGKSGLTYQIVRGRDHLNVYNQGKMVAELCVYVDSRTPSTDHVITKKLIVECDERDIWKRANIYARESSIVKSWNSRKKEVTSQELLAIAA